MPDILRIGTRESQLAVWQATQVSRLLTANGHPNELVYIKSEGDINLTTPLYEMGVQGIFTRSLDIALLNKQIDIAVHSMKDVPVVLPQGITQAAVLERASYKDLLVGSSRFDVLTADWNDIKTPLSIATSSIRRKAQWLHRFPGTKMDNLRGNVNTRLRKLEESDWHGAIFAAAGLERINLRPKNSLELDWMLPAPAQGAILVVCRMDDAAALNACKPMHHEMTALCVKAERDFLRTLMGGCSTPISALATVENDRVRLEGNILSIDGTRKLGAVKEASIERSYSIGVDAAFEILDNGGDAIMKEIRKVEA